MRRVSFCRKPCEGFQRLRPGRRDKRRFQGHEDMGGAEVGILDRVEANPGPRTEVKAQKRWQGHRVGRGCGDRRGMPGLWGKARRPCMPRPEPGQRGGMRAGLCARKGCATEEERDPVGKNQAGQPGKEKAQPARRAARRVALRRIEPEPAKFRHRPPDPGKRGKIIALGGIAHSRRRTVGEELKAKAAHGRRSAVRSQKKMTANRIERVVILLPVRPEPGGTRAKRRFDRVGRACLDQGEPAAHGKRRDVRQTGRRPALSAHRISSC